MFSDYENIFLPASLNISLKFFIKHANYIKASTCIIMPNVANVCNSLI